MILACACYLVHRLLFVMPQWSYPWLTRRLYASISSSDGSPALINDGKSSLWYPWLLGTQTNMQTSSGDLGCSLGYPWLLGTQTLSKDLTYSKVESILVVGPHSLNGLILRAGSGEFRGDSCRKLSAHFIVSQGRQVWNKVWVLWLSRSFQL